MSQCPSNCTQAGCWACLDDVFSCLAQPTVPSGPLCISCSLGLRLSLLRCTAELAAATAGIVAYSPLGRGMLTGAIKSAADLHESDGRAVRMPRFQGENFDKVCPGAFHFYMSVLLC